MEMTVLIYNIIYYAVTRLRVIFWIYIFVIADKHYISNIIHYNITTEIK